MLVLSIICLFSVFFNVSVHMMNVFSGFSTAISLGLSCTVVQIIYNSLLELLSFGLVVLSLELTVLISASPVVLTIYLVFKQVVWVPIICNASNSDLM